MATLHAGRRHRDPLCTVLPWCGVALSLTITACGPAETTPGSPALEQIEGAPADGPTPSNIEVALDPAVTPAALSIYHGAAAVGTSDGILVGSLSTNTLKPLLVVPTGDEPSTTGAVGMLVSRPSGGLFAVGESGLFHDGQGVLLYSPLNAAKELEGNPITSLDASGAEGSEELWIGTAAGAFHVAGGQIAGFEVSSGAGAPQPAAGLVGIGPSQAIVVSGDSVYQVDLDGGSAGLLLEGIGALHGLARAEDGTVYIAADGGLFVRDPTDGALSVYTLSPAGQPAEPVIAVAASFGAVVAATAASLVRIDAGRPVHLADFAAAPAGLAIDGQGDLWSTDGQKVVRHITGAPVSFEADVKPFFEVHCTVCHGGGTSGSPKIDFLDYEEAKERAPTIIKRLRGEGSVMPPTSIEVLTAADYAVVTRWVAGGLLP